VVAASWSELKREMYSLIAWHMHRQDVSPSDTLVRLIEKSTGARIDPARITLGTGLFSLAQLESYRGEPHHNSKPKNSAAPVILYRHKKRLHLIDGQNRLNRWRLDGKHGPHRALIVAPRKR
jgi:hypothetical protein